MREIYNKLELPVILDNSTQKEIKIDGESNLIIVASTFILEAMDEDAV